MQKLAINPYEYATAIVQANPKGILFTTKSGDEVDTMIIGWGLIGNIWGTPTFTAFVRLSRHSRKLVEESGEFTINVPEGKIDPQIFKVAGTESGRDVNKIEKLGLTLVEPEVVATPGILECPITLECKVMYAHQIDTADIPEFAVQSFYTGEGQPDEHIAFYGQIVASYIAKP